MYFITEVFRAVCQWLTFALPSHALQTWGDDSARVTICRTEVHMVEIYIQSESGETWAATDCQKNWVSLLNIYVIILLISSLIGSFLTFTKHVISLLSQSCKSALHHSSNWFPEGGEHFEKCWAGIWSIHDLYNVHQVTQTTARKSITQKCEAYPVLTYGNKSVHVRLSAYCEFCPDLINTDGAEELTWCRRLSSNV